MPTADIMQPMTWKKTPELCDAFCDSVSEVGFYKTCELKAFPSSRTIYRWQDEDPDFAAECARAIELCGERVAAKAEDVMQGMLDGDVDVDKARVALSHLQWRAEKFKPRQFGQQSKLAIESDEPLVVIHKMIPKKKDDNLIEINGEENGE